MNKFVASVTLACVAGMTIAPAIRAGDLADEMHRDHQAIGAAAGKVGRQALQDAGKALEPVIYAGKAVIEGVTYVMLKVGEGIILVAETAVRGVEFAVEGAKFLALKTAEGIIWVAEKAVQAGEILVDVFVEGVKIVVDGVVFVATVIEEGIIFVAETVHAAKATGELIVNGVKFVARKTKEGIVWVAKQAKAVGRAVNRARLVVELRTNLSSSLATGKVGDSTMRYFRSKTQSADPVVARLARSCLAAAEAFNGAYAQ